MSDTPRTAILLKAMPERFAPNELHKYFNILKEHAEQLERELNAMRPNAAQNNGTGLAPDALGGSEIRPDTSSGIHTYDDDDHHRRACGSSGFITRQDNPAPVPPIPAQIEAAIADAENACIESVHFLGAQNGMVASIRAAFAKLRAAVCETSKLTKLRIKGEKG